jgi:hypothetical protein
MYYGKILQNTLPVNFHARKSMVHRRALEIDNKAEVLYQKKIALLLIEKRTDAL